MTAATIATFLISIVHNSSCLTTCIERIMSTCAICLFSKSNVSMLTAVNLSVVRLMTEALSSKIEEDSVSLLC